jgi:hypothetical protein
MGGLRPGGTVKPTLPPAADVVDVDATRFPHLPKILGRSNRGIPSFEIGKIRFEIAMIPDKADGYCNKHWV